MSNSLSLSSSSKVKYDNAEVIDDLFGIQELSKFLSDEDGTDAKTYLKDNDFEMLRSIAESILYEGSRGEQLLGLLQGLEEQHDELQLALKIAQSAVFKTMRGCFNIKISLKICIKSVHN
jgi:hypothetical protein